MPTRSRQPVEKARSAHVPPRTSGDGIFTLARRHLAAVSSKAPRVLVGDDPDAVHDLRVAIRRLQGTFALLGELHGDPSVDRWRRTLRKVRRALGVWRNLDVVLADVENRRRRTRSRPRRDAWTTLRAELERIRVDEIHKARKRVRRADLGSLCAQASSRLSELEGEIEPTAIRRGLRERLAQCWQRWQQGVAHATRDRTTAAVHAVRIATKRLRYDCEIAAEMHQETADGVLSWTRDLQEALGDWHDQQVEHELVAGVLGQPGFLLTHLEVGEVLLAEVARERRSSSDPVSQVPRDSTVDAGRSLVETLIAELELP